MPVKLHRLISALLPPTRGIRLLEVSIEDESVRLQLALTAPTAACPCCAVASSSVHSRYQRRLTDLPWGTRAVHLQLTVRKFLCRNPTCARRIFTERLPNLVAAYGRQTHRLATALRAIGLELAAGASDGVPGVAEPKMEKSYKCLLNL
jgi:transposase